MSDPLISDELSDEPSDFGSLRPGTRLGRYELLLPIARGGMARVWAARQHGTRGFQKLVAIKTILPHLADEPEFERMFLDEARIASGVHHPNVCEIYELGEERGTLYLAMEWVNGDSFSRSLRASGKTEPCDFGIASRVIADACAGAHAAHELEDDDGRKLNVVHRDLSPHNILINADGFTKVCDFGVAKALNQLHEHTQAGQLKGKISYMSPEQVTGDPVDRRSDVFSLGCVLYEATTGRRPFRGEGDHNVMQAIVDGLFDPPAAVVRNYPRDLERIVLRALGNVPNQRFASAEHMRYALEEFLAKGPLVTQSHVATLVRARLGPMLDRRRERIKQASAEGQQGNWDPKSIPPARDPVDHRSGVKPSTPSISPLGQSRRERSEPNRPDETNPDLPRGNHTSFGRMSAKDIAAMNRIGPSSSSTIPSVPPEMLAHASSHGRPGTAIETPESGTPILNATDRKAAASSIEQAIKASLVPSPLDSSSPSVSAKSTNPRAIMEARAMTASVRDVPIPILSPMTGPPGPYDPSLQPLDLANLASGNAVPAEEAPGGAGSYALAIIVGLLFAVAIGGGGLYYWKSRQHPVTTAMKTADSHVASTASAPASTVVPGVATGDVPPSHPAVATSASAPIASVPVDAGPAPTTSAKKKARPKPEVVPENPY